MEKIQETSLKNIKFYNEIALEYDHILDEEASNKMVRKRVKEKFISLVKPGYVLDFGGGTGRDLNWLIDHQYQVVFCEPSEGMRKKAIDQYSNHPLKDNITFLGDAQIDFSSWHLKPPFTKKADAILSDFAVINCIADIELLFCNLARLVKPGGHLIALLLNNRYKKTWRWKLKELVRSIFGKTEIVNVNYHDHQQVVHLYSKKTIIKASAGYFDCQSQENLFEFTLFHFTRK